MPPTRVAVVAHTHWDREWHTPFEAARLRLVQIVEDIVDVLEHDDSFTHFLLDGQTAPIDDVIVLRPDLEHRLARLIRAGRLTVGPWTVLPDEFLVSGETLVRNLAEGLRRRAELTGDEPFTPPVGYVPDSFGHTAQMPQILRQVGITDAVVWRGVPAAIDRTGFWWQGLDGSRVRVEHLYGSYANGRGLPDDPPSLVERTDSYRRELGRRSTGSLLLMNGGDQRGIEFWVPDLLAAANSRQRKYHFELTSLPEYLETATRKRLPSWRGELRSSAYANLLPGVVSNRVDLRRAAAQAEHAVEGRAARLDAIVPGAPEHATAALAGAWRLLVLNSAHDSVCGCTTDDVSRAVMGRYEQAGHIGDEIAAQALQRLATATGAERGTIVVVNPSTHERHGLVDVLLTEPSVPCLQRIDGSPARTQTVGQAEPDDFVAVARGHKLGWIRQMIDGHRFGGVPVGSVATERGDDGSTTVTMSEAQHPRSAVDLFELGTELEALANADQLVHVRLRRLARPRVLVETGPVPAAGWTTLLPDRDPLVSRAADTTESSSDVRVSVATGGDEVSMSNGIVEVRLEPDATWSLTTAEGLSASGLGRLVDGGDGGDTYNWSAPGDDTVVDRPTGVESRVVESGPLRGRIEQRATYQLPVAAVGDEVRAAERTAERAPVVVTTTLELRVGDPLLYVATNVDNRVRDHRLRAHFPLPKAAARTYAGCAFGVVQRSGDTEGGPHERGVATYPAQGFVHGGDTEAGLAVLLDAVSEYELVDEGRELALTLLRATGYLSRIAPDARPNPAGPALAVEQAQLQGSVRRDYALWLHRGGWENADVPRRADDYRRPLESVVAGRSVWPRAQGVDALSLIDSRIAVDGASVTSLRREGDEIVVRLVRLGTEPGSVTVTRGGQRVRGRRVDLVGRDLGDFDTSVELDPFEIATLLLD